MRVVILTCVHRRSKITSIFIQNYLLLKKSLSAVKIDLHLIICGDKKDDLENYNLYLPHKDKVTWVNSPNFPLSNKWNKTSRKLKSITFDYALILGSDDIISARTLRVLLRLAANGYNYLGITDMYILNSETGKLSFWAGYHANRKGETIGAGRLLHKDIIKELNYTLWDRGLNKSLDASLTRKIKSTTLPIKHTGVSCAYDDVFLMDIKSSENIWSFDTFHNDNGTYVDTLETLVNNTSPRLIQFISQLIPLSSNA